MALFTLRKGYKVISSPQGARVVDTQGVEQRLTPLEVQILARAAAEGLNHKSTYLPAVIRRLSEQGLLEEVAASTRVSAFDELEVDIDAGDATVTPAAPLKLEDTTLALRQGLKMTPDRAKGVVQVSDPATGKSFSLYDFELSLAQMLNGKRTVGEIINSGQRIGIPVDLASLTQFLRQLDRYGFLAKPSGEAPDVPIARVQPRREWNEGVRVLFQTGMRLSRQGRYTEAASYFEAMLQQDPENAEAKEELAKARSAEPSPPATDDAAKGTDPAVPLIPDVPLPPSLPPPLPPSLPTAEAAVTPDAAPTQPVELPPAAEVPPAASAGSRRPLVLFGVLGVVAVGAGAWALLGRVPAPAPVVARPTPKPAVDAPAAVVVVTVDAGAEAAATPINAGEIDIALEDEIIVKDAGTRDEPKAETAVVAEKTPLVAEKAPVVAEKASVVAEKAPAPPSEPAGEPADSIAVTVDRRGRATMGEIVADAAGTLHRRAAEEERVKKNQPVGELKSSGKTGALNAPIAGLVFWQVSADGPVKEGAKLAKLLYHEAYVMGWVQGATPLKTWHCELRDGETGVTAPCLVTGVEKRAKGWYVTLTGEPTWVERTGGLGVRLNP